MSSWTTDDNASVIKINKELGQSTLAPAVISTLGMVDR